MLTRQQPVARIQQRVWPGLVNKVRLSLTRADDSASRRQLSLVLCHLPLSPRKKMDLSQALDGDWPSPGNSNQPGAWPQQPNQPNPSPWPGAPNQPSHPPWPSAPTQPNQPNQPPWPGAPTQPNQPNQPPWPGAPAQGGSWFPGQPSNPAPAPAPAPAPSPGSGGWFTPSTGGSTSLSVPYNQKFPGGLRAGSVININGTIKPNANKVTVDISTAQDLAFHFNPRFNEGGKKVIVRNSKIGGRWGGEERQLLRFPFVAGQPFQMRIECTSQMFKVLVDGSHILDFKHRTGNLSHIQKLDIYNDVTLSHVSVQ
ncbi:galectin-3b isoform X2 [Corythoichthys intestinalis]|uniref:galectin-3b isoform X2 n=1 Tax=Corythoichthys intestinalis TaxID=161448 RepID=UPI0025A52636|nr:galectin-3b isoform X2 [Corythoichthys intestinalis]